MQVKPIFWLILNQGYHVPIDNIFSIHKLPSILFVCHRQRSQELFPCSTAHLHKFAYLHGPMSNYFYQFGWSAFSKTIWNNTEKTKIKNIHQTNSMVQNSKVMVIPFWHLKKINTPIHKI